MTRGAVDRGRLTGVGALDRLPAAPTLASSMRKPLPLE